MLTNVWKLPWQYPIAFEQDERLRASHAYIERYGERLEAPSPAFCFCIIIGGLGTAAFVQPYAISSALDNAWHRSKDHNHCCTVCALVLIGGVKDWSVERLSLSCASSISLSSAPWGCQLPEHSFSDQSHFHLCFHPLMEQWGMAGAVTTRQGAARGTFSNEAGCGTSAITTPPP